MPDCVTRARVPYRWLLPQRASPAIKLMKLFHRKVILSHVDIGGWRDIAVNLSYWFDKHVLEPAAEAGCVATMYSPSRKKYSLESARLGKAAAAAPAQVKEEPSAPLTRPCPRDPPLGSRLRPPGCAELVSDELSAG